MRFTPELITMVKGMRVAIRGVSCSLLMIVVLVYVFAIVLHMFLKDVASLKSRFGRLGECMWTLLMDGTFMDSTGATLAARRKEDQYPMVCVFMVFMHVDFADGWHLYGQHRRYPGGPQEGRSVPDGLRLHGLHAAVRDDRDEHAYWSPLRGSAG